jgi:hypothetical protein
MVCSMLCDTLVLELTERRTRLLRDLKVVEESVLEHGFLRWMLGTVFGWFGMGDWQVILELGIFYGVSRRVGLA